MNLIIDIQNKCWYHIPYSIENLLSKTIDKDISKYLKNHAIILEIPPYLRKNLPKINTSYHSPQKKESLIIDIDSNSKHSIISILKLFECYNLLHLQVRYFSIPNWNELKDILEYLDFTTLEAVELIIPYDLEIICSFIKDKYIEKISKLFRVFFHSTPKIAKIKPQLRHKKILYTNDEIKNESYCGNISAFNFSNNPKHVLKSINYNSCLYKKIGIDKDGNIKNCPSLEESKGNVRDITDENITNLFFHTEKIIKDEIEVCKDCEFRYVCTDCRAYTDSRNRQNSRPSKCNYNPYIAKWSHEEKFITLAECGVVSNENEFSIDYERIAMINKQLWGE